jgi:cell cycle related kinase
VQSLEKLQHAHVIDLYEYFPHGSSIVIAFEYMISDLHQVMRCLSAEGRPVAEPVIKSIMTMLLKGVAGVHASNLIHRDLKPANLLFSPTGILKLGDFGLARVHDEEQKAKYPMSHEVATRWYRAPELLFGGRHYGNAVDLWAVGLMHQPVPVNGWTLILSD